MNDFENDDLYELSGAEGKKNAQGLVTALLYLVLAAVVIITGAHAVMLVLSQTAAYTAGTGSLIDTVLTAIRVAFPLLVELAAVVAGIGFIQARWRGAQKSVGLGIELIWLTFAAANMITVLRRRAWSGAPKLADHVGAIWAPHVGAHRRCANLHPPAC
jgi:hypothetical protein